MSFVMMFVMVFLIRKYGGVLANILLVLGPIDGHCYLLT